MPGSLKPASCLLFFLCSTLTAAYDNYQDRHQPAASPAELSGRETDIAGLECIVQALPLQAGKVHWMQYLGHSVQSSLRPSVPGSYIPMGGGILAHAHSLADHEDDGATDDHPDGHDEGEANVQTMHSPPAWANGIEAVMELTPDRPYVQGKGLHARESLVSKMKDSMLVCDHFWGGHINADYQECMGLMVTAEVAVMLQLERIAPYSKEHVEGALRTMKQRMDVAGQHLVPEGKPAEQARACPDLWEALHLIRDKHGLKGSDATSCAACSESMHSKPKGNITIAAMLLEDHSAKEAMKPEDDHAEEAMKAQGNSAKEAMQPEDTSATKALEPVTHKRFSWMWDSRASTIEAWYQELCKLHHAGNITSMGLHLEGCVQDATDGSCQLAPAWMQTAFSWTGRLEASVVFEVRFASELGTLPVSW